MTKVKKFESSEVTIEIDQDACISCGTCEVFAPKTFEFDKNLKTQVKGGSHDSKDKIISAAESCAVEAITIIDNKTNKKLYPK